jgi:Fe-S cluster assembly protein SufD
MISAIETPSAPASTEAYSLAAFELFLATRNEPDWLVERRRAAFELFRTLSWPTSRDEEWRRTDIRSFKLDNIGSIPSPAPVSDADRSSVESVWDGLRASYSSGLEQINGEVSRTPEGTLPEGVVFLDLNEAVRKHPAIVQKYLLTDAVKAENDALAALHAAFYTGGTFVYVPKGVKVDAPLFSLVAMTGQGRVDFDHTLVIVEDGGTATLVRETTSKGRDKSQALHCGAVELFVGEGANLCFVNVQNWDLDTWHFSRERALVGKNGSLQWTVGGLGSRLAKVNQEVALTGPKASAQVNGVMFTTGKQHLAYFTRQDHAAPQTKSDLLYKGGLKDKSRMVWKGMIRVEKDAQKTDAYQKNDNLLLSDTARGDSIPGLEIEANDVRCTHGATAGRVDEEMIFYAQARGVRRDTAIRLIVEGFFANVYDRITLEPVRETLRRAVAEKLQIGSTPTIHPEVDI